MATVEQLQKDGEDLFPVTRAEAVYDEDDVTLQTRVNNGVYLDDESEVVPVTPWVTGDDIVWSSLGNKAVSSSDTISFGTTSVVALSLTASASGTYLITGNIGTYGGDDGAFVRLDLGINSDTIATNYASVYSGRATMNIATVAQVDSGDTVKLLVGMGSGTANTQSRTRALSIIRIA